MLWNNHSELKGKHAFLSPSGYTWINYSDDELFEKLTNKYSSYIRTPIGTAIHKYAASQILLKQKPGKGINTLIKNIKNYLQAQNDFAIENDINPPYSEEFINYVGMLPEHVYQTVILYITDCISFNMISEKELKFSDNCFGTTDAISFNNNTLRISDLKTGDIEAHIEQLYIYAALFCLEYHYRPTEIKIEFRLYQYGMIKEVTDPSVETITKIMDRITLSNKMTDKIRGKE